jgi:hypothetical protein
MQRICKFDMVKIKTKTGLLSKLYLLWVVSQSQKVVSATYQLYFVVLQW